MLSFFKQFFAVDLDDVVPFSMTDGDRLDSAPGSYADAVAGAASDRTHRPHFLQLVIEHGIWAIVRLDESVSERDVHFLQYEDGPANVLPVFSSMEHASAFIHSTEFSELLPLQCIHMPADFLVMNDLSDLRVIMNPRASTTTEIGSTDLATLRNYMHQQF